MTECDYICIIYLNNVQKLVNLCLSYNDNPGIISCEVCYVGRNQLFVTQK